MSLLGLLTQRANIFKGVRSVDANGEERIAWSLYRIMPCVVEGISQYALIKMGIESRVTHKILIEYDSELYRTPGASWRVDVREDGPSIRTYIMVEAKDPAHRRHHLELAVRRMDEKILPVIEPQSIGSAEAFGAVSLG